MSHPTLLAIACANGAAVSSPPLHDWATGRRVADLLACPRGDWSLFIVASLLYPSVGGRRAPFPPQVLALLRAVVEATRTSNSQEWRRSAVDRIEAGTSTIGEASGDPWITIVAWAPDSLSEFGTTAAPRGSKAVAEIVRANVTVHDLEDAALTHDVRIKCIDCRRAAGTA